MAEPLFPYPTMETPPRLTVSSPRVDGEPCQILPRESVVELAHAPAGWRRATLNVRLLADPGELDRIGVEQLRAVVTVHCGSSNLRVATALASSGIGMWSGEVELEREALAGRGRIDGVVAGVVAGVPDRLVGRSVPVELYADGVPTVALGGGAVRLQWVDFTTSENPRIDPVYHGETSHLDLNDDSTPVIYLNAAIPGFRRLMDERPGRSAVERSVREAVFAGIACPGLVAMGNVAISASFGDGGQPEWPEVDWQREALQTLLPLMYPDQEPHSALATATAAYREPLDARDLQTRLHVASIQALKTTADVRRALRTLDGLDEKEA